MTIGFYLNYKILAILPIYYVTINNEGNSIFQLFLSSIIFLTSPMKSYKLCYYNPKMNDILHY